MNIPDAELIIVGGGPAGLTAAQYGARANLSVLVIEQLAPGGQALLIDKLENYPGAAPDMTGYDFAERLQRQAGEFGAQFLSDSVVSLEKNGDSFTITLGSGGTLKGPAVIIATGTKHRTLGIPGEAEFYGRGVSYCAACDGPFFKNKKIFVAGGGDAACDEAQYLSRLSSQVVLIHRRDRFRAQKAVAERTLKNPNITVRFNTRLLEIRGGRQVSSALLEQTDTGNRYEEDAAAVFIFIGAVPQTDFVSALDTETGASIERDENGYILTDQAMATGVPGLFAAGDVRASPFRQVVVAAGEGAAAAHSAAAYIAALKGEAYQ
ncbi:MAG: thioredoxin-disulfide reductase [Spirochaetaceae bacterium]|jgi:thioredoxin reductase (NADPH)|nr:thioredoxin-disulfide reductase [Spirochaetaceae bacterium]